MKHRKNTIRLRHKYGQVPHKHEYFYYQMLDVLHLQEEYGYINQQIFMERFKTTERTWERFKMNARKRGIKCEVKQLDTKHLQHCCIFSKSGLRDLL